jgi:hypothetical protein
MRASAMSSEMNNFLFLEARDILVFLAEETKKMQHRASDMKRLWQVCL